MELHSIEHNTTTVTTIVRSYRTHVACFILHAYTVSNKHKQLYVVVEQIGKRGISFSGSQYGSCSTIYNTLPVTKVVYN